MKTNGRCGLAVMIALLLLAISAPGVVARPSHASTPTATNAGVVACDLKVALRGGPQVDSSVTASVGQEVEFYGSGFVPDTNVEILFGRPLPGQSFVLTVTTDEFGEFAFAIYFVPGEEDQWTVRAPSVAPAPSCTGSDQVQVIVQTGHPFTDIANHLFEAEITWLYQRGITTGCGTNVFCPDAAVTREQMASFLARALALPGPIGDYFVDDAGSPHEADINRVKEAGITLGCGAYLFCPDDPITREQMASFLARALALPGPIGDYFVDDAGSQHQADINRLKESGITAGCGAYLYCPAEFVSRGQMAAFLERALF